ncbi:ferrochelatase [soil metagenome]
MPQELDAPQRPAPDPRPYDAFLLVSFGGPEKPDDVVPFLQNVTVGKGIPPERLLEVGEHYFGFGGKSPINDQCRALIAALEKEFADRGIDIPVYWGNRNWDPYLAGTVTTMADAGVRRAAAFLTSAYSSYSSCRQYRENLFDATEGSPVEIDRIRHYFNHPGFVGPFVSSLVESLDGRPADTHIAFVTHSIPTTMNAASGGPDAGAYALQHEDVARVVVEEVAARTGVTHPWSLSYCSRSGPPAMPWLEPDINDRLADLHGDGTTSVAVVPIGFVSDHMEVIYDLDTEAAETAAGLGLDFIRIPTPGVDAAFVAMVADLFEERAAAARGEEPPRPAVGSRGPSHYVCPVACCANPRLDRPALCGADTPPRTSA